MEEGLHRGWGWGSKAALDTVSDPSEVRMPQREQSSLGSEEGPRGTSMDEKLSQMLQDSSENMVKSWRHCELLNNEEMD
jgi:hypothetical protein